MVSLNRFSAINVDGNAHRLSGLRRPALESCSPMNENVAAFLRINHAKLADFRAIMPSTFGGDPQWGAAAAMVSLWPRDLRRTWAAPRTTSRRC